MAVVRQLTMAELEAGLDHIREAPKDNGVLEMIVRRPEEDGREVLEEGQLDLAVGLVGDTWNVRGSSKSEDGGPHPDCQLNIMNVRATALVAQEKDRWPLAGDQLYVDFDLSEANIPPGTRLAIGTAIVEVSVIPHLGCKKFVARFGNDAMKFVNSTVGKDLHLRGINAKVIQPGVVRVGDAVRKVT